MKRYDQKTSGTAQFFSIHNNNNNIKGLYQTFEFTRIRG